MHKDYKEMFVEKSEEIFNVKAGIPVQTLEAKDNFLTYENRHDSLNENKSLSTEQRFRSEIQPKEMPSNILNDNMEEKFSPNNEIIESENLKKLWIDDIDKLKFEIENGKRKIIGEGGQGKVYLAKYGNELVAVKKIPNFIENQKYFFRECNIMAEFSNSNIIRIKGYHIDITKKKNYIAMEYAPFGSLKEFLRNKSHENLDFDIVCKIICGLLEGLPLLHDKNIIHRDIKPVNILIGDNYIPKYSDFGISKWILSSKSNFNTNIPRGETFKALGTNKFMAPEVSENFKYSKKADIYSLGLVLDLTIRSFRKIIPKDVEDFLNLAITQCKSVEPENRPEITHLLTCFKDLATRSKFNSKNNSFQDDESFLKETELIRYPEIDSEVNKFGDDQTSLDKADFINSKESYSEKSSENDILKKPAIMYMYRFFLKEQLNRSNERGEANTFTNKLLKNMLKKY